MNNYLQSITLQNFRSWKEGFVEFCEGVNVVIGENDNGKTNILRAINWAANNRPSGEDYRSHWGGDTSVILDIGNKKVGRHRTDKDNYYTLTGYKDPFRAFGVNVPEPIKQFLNLSAVNIAFQLDGPFLLGKSPPEVARYYNDAVNLDVIDRSISNIRKTLSKENDQLSNKQNEKDRLEEQLKEFEWLDEAESALIQLEQHQKIILKKQSEFSELSALSKTLKALDEEYLKTEKITRYESEVLALLKINETIERKQKEYQELYHLAQFLKKLNEQGKQIKKVLLFEGKVEELLSLDKLIEEKLEEYNLLADLIKTIRNCEKEERKAQKKIKYEKELDALLKLNQEIEDKTNQYDELFNLKQRIIILDNDLEEAINMTKRLEKEFSQLLPNKCPIFDIECEHINEIKNDN